MSTIPDDLVEEILCRVPATNLKALRTTCQRWNRLYKDSRFARNHFDKSPKELFPIMLTINYRISPLSINFTHKLFRSVIIPSVELQPDLTLKDPKNPSFEFYMGKVLHCDGFLLCISEDESSLVVWNPLTSETRWIEPMKGLKKNRTFVLGYCNKSKSYKILSFDSDGSEIYEFRSGLWKVLDYDISLGWSLYPEQCVSFKGSAYMFAKEIGKWPSRLLSLIAFDFSTERSTLVSLPGERNGIHESVSVSVVGEEKIAVLLKHKRESETEIWVSNKINQGTKVVSWSKVLALDSSVDLQIMYSSSFLLDEEKKILVCCTRWIEVDNTYVDTISIVEDGDKVTEEDFGQGTGDECWPTIHNYVPSLVRIDTRGNERPPILYQYRRKLKKNKEPMIGEKVLGV